MPITPWSSGNSPTTLVARSALHRRAAVIAVAASVVAAIGFAQKNGVDPAALERAAVPGKKGEYAIAVREVTGQDAMAVLPALLAELIAQFPWPKSMRWGWGEADYEVLGQNGSMLMVSASGTAVVV